MGIDTARLTEYTECEEYAKRNAEIAYARGDDHECSDQMILADYYALLRRQAE